MRLAGKVAIVTGGGSGFGEGIAKRFAEEGAKLVVNDIDDAGGKRVTAEIEKAHGQGSAIYVRGDVAKNDDVKALVDACVARFSHLDIMVNNAGISRSSPSTSSRSISRRSTSSRCSAARARAASSSTPPRRRGSGRAPASPSTTPRKAPRSS